MSHQGFKSMGFMLLKGFKFGMLLQLAVGPVCLALFQTAAARGFQSSLLGVAGVTLADGLFILAAAAGLGAVLESQKIKKPAKILGALVLTGFGLDGFIRSLLNLTGLPPEEWAKAAVLLQDGLLQGEGQPFLKMFFLTASNPLTILFWAGVFSGKIAQEAMTKRELFLYSGGALLATPVFLTLIGAAGSFTGSFLPQGVLCLMNGAVGIVLIVFGFKALLKKR